MALTYFSLAELRALPDMDDETLYPDDVCTAAGEAVEADIENFVGTSFVARTVTDEAHDGGCWEIPLDSPFVLADTAPTATEGGVAVTDFLFVRSGVLRRLTSQYASSPVRWADGFGNVEVTYAAGYSEAPPANVKQAALAATRYRLITSAPDASMNGRAESIQNDFGNVRLSIADKDHPFGLPEVDAVLIGWRDRLDVFGFA